MRVTELIHKKRQGEALSQDEISWLVENYTAGNIPDYQMSAFTMAVWFRGMTEEETVALTNAMMRSGDTVDLSCFGDFSIDKHSTGGVGDKTTLIIAPIVASLGGKMAKMSGRGLGHTGGTVDKLESIPGFRVELTPESFLQQVEEIGVAVIGQSGNLTPADKKLYALRDVTDTVDSMPLIVSSIMSKKLAAGAKNIVLDVKVGSGTFISEPDEARELARQMVSIGKACGRNVTAILTNMDVPLGTHVGNALEVVEAIEVLKGRGCTDLTEVCVSLASRLVAMFRGISVEEAEQLVRMSIESGTALKTMETWIRAQGGNADVLYDYSLLPGASVSYALEAPFSGYIRDMDTRLVGGASVLLGAGRSKKEDPIDYGAGIVLKKKTGDFVCVGETLAVLYSNNETLPEKAAHVLLQAFEFGDTAPEEQKLILGVVE